MGLSDPRLKAAQARMFGDKRGAPRRAPGGSSDNPHLDPRVRGAGFFNANIDRLLNGWDNASSTMDFYLRSELRPLRARSREMVRTNPFGKRFIATLKSNVVGPGGVKVQAQSMRYQNGRASLDTPANDAIEAAFRDWAEYHCDYLGRSRWVDLQNLAISCAGQDGEFLFQKILGRRAGKYGFQLKAIDPELLDVTKNHKTKRGEIRLGVEYDATGRVIRYHFRKKEGGSYTTGYMGGEEYSLPAASIIHGYVNEWPDQSRGIPWAHASLETAKHLDKYDESALVSARLGASTMGIIHGDESDRYEGDEDGTGEYEGSTLDSYEPGTFKDIGNRNITQLDPSYPHQMYADFVKTSLRRIASGLGISYHTLSSDLEGVNYSSIRASVLEDREIFKGLQDWFIRSLIRPVYEDWVAAAWMNGQLRVGGVAPLSRPFTEYLPASYQARRWDWVDPAKDGQANDLAVKNRTTSISQIIRDKGGDPESLFREIKRERELLEELGILPEDTTPQPEAPPDA